LLCIRPSFRWTVAWSVTQAVAPTAGFGDMRIGVAVPLCDRAERQNVAAEPVPDG
jgi:hypothetical protein